MFIQINSTFCIYTWTQLPIKTDTASGEKKSLNSGYIYKLIVTTYIRRFSNLKCLYLEDLGKYSRYISQVHYLPVNPYRLHAASTDTLHTVWSQEVHINRNEAYRSSIILPQLRRDALSTHFKRTRYINIPSLSATNTLKNQDYSILNLPTFFTWIYEEWQQLCCQNRDPRDSERCQNVPFRDENLLKRCMHTVSRTKTINLYQNIPSFLN